MYKCPLLLLTCPKDAAIYLVAAACLHKNYLLWYGHLVLTCVDFAEIDSTLACGHWLKEVWSQKPVFSSTNAPVPLTVQRDHEHSLLGKQIVLEVLLILRSPSSKGLLLELHAVLTMHFHHALQPGKAEPLCNRWWVALQSTSVINTNNVEEWGLVFFCYILPTTDFQNVQVQELTQVWPLAGKHAARLQKQQSDGNATLQTWPLGGNSGKNKNTRSSKEKCLNTSFSLWEKNCRYSKESLVIWGGFGSQRRRNLAWPSLGKSPISFNIR